MKILNIGNFLIPMVVFLIILYAFFKKVKIYDSFIV